MKQNLIVKMNGRELKADEGAGYDAHEEIVLDDLVPLIALAKQSRQCCSGFGGGR
jgi:hypothetical protein